MNCGIHQALRQRIDKWFLGVCRPRTTCQTSLNGYEIHATVSVYLMYKHPQVIVHLISYTNFSRISMHWSTLGLRAGSVWQQATTSCCNSWLVISALIFWRRFNFLIGKTLFVFIVKITAPSLKTKSSLKGCADPPGNFGTYEKISTLSSYGTSARISGAMKPNVPVAVFAKASWINVLDWPKSASLAPCELTLEVLLKEQSEVPRKDVPVC